MRASRITFILLAFSILSFTTVKAQDVGYSQYYANPLYLNPALAGIKICPRITLNYRNQWPALNKGYVSYSASFDQLVSQISGGIGVLANADVMGGGMMSVFNGGAMYSFRLKVSDDITVNTALQAGYIQYRLNWDKLIFEDQIVPGTGEIISGNEQPPSRLNVGDLDFAAGFVAGYRESYYLGAAVHHITVPDLSFYQASTNRLDMRITVHAGAYIDLESGISGQNIEALSISPNVVYMQQGKFHQLNLGLYGNLYPFVGGLWFRHNFENPDAAIVLIGFQQQAYKIGYSFDFTISRVSMRSGGAHEVSFAWQLPCPKKEFKYRAIKCPRF